MDPDYYWIHFWLYQDLKHREIYCFLLDDEYNNMQIFRYIQNIDKIGIIIIIKICCYNNHFIYFEIYY